MATFEELEKYICIICQELLLDPVVLPCQHTACLYCLEQTLDHNKYQCFLCRKSIQSWYRRTRRANGLVNEKLRAEISVKFPDLCAKRLNGESLDIMAPSHPRPILSHPGEIRRDFESESAQLRQQMEKEREKENRLSEELIKQIEEEENRLKLEEEEKLRKDGEMARELARQLEDASTSTGQDSVQLDLDETYARELAYKEAVSVTSPKMMEKTMSYFDENSHASKRLDIDDKLGDPVRIAKENRFDANPARKSFNNTNNNNNEPGHWRTKLSPNGNKMKRKLARTYGPMDRFIQTKKPN